MEFESSFQRLSCHAVFDTHFEIRRWDNLKEHDWKILANGKTTRRSDVTVKSALQSLRQPRCQFVNAGLTRNTGPECNSSESYTGGILPSFAVEQRKLICY
jgi:hypothetical protein